MTTFHDLYDVNTVEGFPLLRQIPFLVQGPILIFTSAQGPVSRRFRKVFSPPFPLPRLIFPGSHHPSTPLRYRRNPPCAVQQSPLYTSSIKENDRFSLGYISKKIGRMMDGYVKVYKLNIEPLFQDNVNI